MPTKKRLRTTAAIPVFHFKILIFRFLFNLTGSRLYCFGFITIEFNSVIGKLLLLENQPVAMVSLQSDLLGFHKISFRDEPTIRILHDALTEIRNFLLKQDIKTLALVYSPPAKVSLRLI